MKSLGTVLSFAVMLLPAVLAVFVESERAAALRARIVRALDAAGLSRKEAAAHMRLSVQRLSDALTGKYPLTVHRLADLPDAFWLEMDALNVEARQGVAIFDARIARLVAGVDRLVMAKTELPQQKGRVSCA